MVDFADYRRIRGLDDRGGTTLLAIHVRNASVSQCRGDGGLVVEDLGLWDEEFGEELLVVLGLGKRLTNFIAPVFVVLMSAQRLVEYVVIFVGEFSLQLLTDVRLLTELERAFGLVDLRVEELRR